MSEVLRLSSAAYSLLHILVLFFLFYVPRYSKKKTLLITGSIMGPLIIFNLILLSIIEQAAFGKLVLFLMVLPSFALFIYLAKHRDFRFVFTFCLADTISAEIILLSLIFNAYLTPDTNIMMALIRIIGFPLVEYIIVKKLRKMYFEVQDSLSKGWGIFSLVAILFYVMMLFMTAWPTLITERPDDMVVMLMILVLMPVMYLNIFQILSNQNRLYNMRREQELWQIKSEHMQKQINQIEETEERIRRERHNLRQRLQTIDAMLQKNEIQEKKNELQSCNTFYCRRSRRRDPFRMLLQNCL